MAQHRLEHLEEIASSCIRVRLVGLRGGDLRHHDVERLLDRQLDLWAEADGEVLDQARLARHDDDLARELADRADEPQHGLRVHAVRGDHLAVLDRPRVVGGVGLDHVQRAGLAALPETSISTSAW